MDKVMETRRAKFESALKRDWADYLVALDRDGDGYVFGDINAAWWGYCEALDSLCVELPELAPNYMDDDGESCFLSGVSASRSAIHAAGVKTK